MLLWITFYYYYAAVKVYNFLEKEKWVYSGCLWIRKKRGRHYLKVPREMLDNSTTTKYKFISQSGFHKRKRGETIQINFTEKYDVTVEIEAEITVKNYIATSHQL